VRTLPGLLRATDNVDVLARPTSGTLRFEITCSGRCGLWIRAHGEIRLNGMLIDAIVEDEWAHLTLPYAGAWTVDGVRYE
jgi:hypothetical protein